jgi:hypothetical protein
MFAGFADVRGLARASTSELVLEFVVQEALFKLFKSDVKEVRIPRDEIEFVQLRLGWFRTSVRIRVKSLKWLAALPGCNNADFTLRVARRDRGQAAEFVRVLSGV